MTSKDYLEKVTIGNLAELSEKIILDEYNPHWKLMFQREKSRIEKALCGKEIIVEHVGSTSVPGLCAKPIIDILLLVPDSADETYYVRLLQDAGYVLRIREPEWFEHRMFKGKSPEVNLHVFSIGCKEADPSVCKHEKAFGYQRLEICTRVCRCEVRSSERNIPAYFCPVESFGGPTV